MLFRSGQDPYGFDVAVKRIKKKKQLLNPDKKALVNDRDFHVVERGYYRRILYRNYGPGVIDDAYYGGFIENPLSYGSKVGFSANSLGLNTWYNRYDWTGVNGYLTELDSEQRQKEKDNIGNYFYHGANALSYGKASLSEIFYHDVLENCTRRNRPTKGAAIMCDLFGKQINFVFRFR